MKIGFYSPYLDTLGGGERYVLTLASHWSGRHNVELFWNDASIINSAQKRLNIDLSRIKVTRNIFRDTSVFKKLFITRQYDLIFFLSDGSIPSTLARYNILHFQMPFGKILYSAVKLSRYQAIVCNSQFTKDALDERIGIRAEVIYPPVTVIDWKGSKKEKIILSVGRFSGFHTAKKQHILLEAFTRGMKAKCLAGWKLILAGGLLLSDMEYFDTLKKMSVGLPVEFLPNAPHDTLTDLYRRVSIYWHAAGFGETDPRLMEHFGISTVEAMTAGCIPIVFAGGGQPEIVEDGKNGFLWETTGELLEKTNNVIINKNIAATLQKNAIEKSKQFSVSRFCDAFDGLLDGISL
ncbi:MAG: glycosyltransferase family 4 protein [Patescibacteria group bacterium]